MNGSKAKGGGKGHVEGTSLAKYVDDLWWASIRLEDLHKKDGRWWLGRKGRRMLYSGFSRLLVLGVFFFFFFYSPFLSVSFSSFFSSSFPLLFLLLYSIAEIMFFVALITNIFSSSRIFCICVILL